MHRTEQKRVFKQKQNIFLALLVAEISRSKDREHYLRIYEQKWNKSIFKLVLFVHFEKVNMTWKLLDHNFKCFLLQCSFVVNWKKWNVMCSLPLVFFLCGWQPYDSLYIVLPSLSQATIAGQLMLHGDFNICHRWWCWSTFHSLVSTWNSISCV